MKAYVFPGQGAQFSGMGKDLYESSAEARALFNTANQVLGFDLAKIMFEGTVEELTQTKVTQPAVFVHAVAVALNLGADFKPNMVAGHSLGEFSALVAAKVLSFEQGLQLVSERALAMQMACEKSQSTMAAVLNLADEKVEEICKQIAAETGLTLIAANYNCPGQLVISGHTEAVSIACDKMKEAGAKRALVLPVGGAFHSPLMEPARAKLAAAIEAAEFHKPICPIYQNVDARPYSDIDHIKNNLIAQLTAPVRWTATVENMVADGALTFIECGPGKVLQGLVKKISPETETTAA